MNSIELLKYFTRKDKKVFAGVFPSDCLPSKFTLPVALIVNTAPRTSPGEHWCGIYISKKKEGFYFDSFGRKPTVESIKKFLHQNCTTINYNTKQIQHLQSKKCGQFSAVFLKFRINDHTSDYFLNLFNTNLMLNEKLIQSYFNYFLQ
jgi:Adenovirus endoprotease